MSIAKNKIHKNDKNKLTALTSNKEFLKYKSILKVGKGDIKKDIELAREKIAEKYK